MSVWIWKIWSCNSCPPGPGSRPTPIAMPNMKAARAHPARENVNATSAGAKGRTSLAVGKAEPAARSDKADRAPMARDRKSTRLNSSHGYISYAVFCLKKKKTESFQRSQQNGQYFSCQYLVGDDVHEHSAECPPFKYDLAAVENLFRTLLLHLCDLSCS